MRPTANGGHGASKAPGLHGRVLVVDDEPAILLALEMAFKRAGFAVVVAHSGETAEAHLRTMPFDVLVVDLRMPDVRGDVVYHQAVALQPHLRRQTLFLTADGSDRGKRIIDACGCPLVAKPFNLSDLLQAIGALIPARDIEESA